MLRWKTFGRPQRVSISFNRCWFGCSFFFWVSGLARPDYLCRTWISSFSTPTTCDGRLPNSVVKNGSRTRPSVSTRVNRTSYSAKETRGRKWKAPNTDLSLSQTPTRNLTKCDPPLDNLSVADLFRSPCVLPFKLPSDSREPGSPVHLHIFSVK